MFRLNRLTDYAVVVLTRMAGRVGDVSTAQQIAHETGVPQPTVAKMLNILARERLVASHRGAAGGYSLMARAEDITMARVIQALEGPIALTACVQGSENQCEVEGQCPMRGNWNHVNRAIRGALEQVTLADMMRPDLNFAAPQGSLAKQLSV